MPGNVAVALVLSTLAGLSTTIGSFLAIFVRKPSSRFMAVTLGFSAGVMLLLSFMELLRRGIDTVGFLPAYLAFFVGMFIMFVLDVLIPHQYLAERAPSGGQDAGLLKTGLLVALGIAVHNFPEGMATLAGTLQDVTLGAAIALAIALHNIPEGLAVSVPVYAATGSRRTAFLWSFLAGVAEPVGALVAAILLLPLLNDDLLGLMLSAVAGVMVFISLDELVPVARSYGEAHVSIIGVVMGMAVMVISLWLLGGSL
jgi:ZIP family zinc transporter